MRHWGVACTFSKTKAKPKGADIPDRLRFFCCCADGKWKKQVKADAAELRRILMRRPGKKERANPEEEGRRIVVAAEKLDRSSTHLRELASQQQGS